VLTVAMARSSSDDNTIDTLSFLDEVMLLHYGPRVALAISTWSPCYK